MKPSGKVFLELMEEVGDVYDFRETSYSLPEVLLHASSFWQICLYSQPGNSSLSTGD